MSNIMSHLIWISEKLELNALIRFIEIFSKLGIPILQFRGPRKIRPGENEENGIYKALCFTNERNYTLTLKYY